jgi:hypothetical protein
LQTSSINDTDSKAAFALVYEAILELSEEQCSGTSASNNWLENDSESDIQEGNNFTGLPSTSNLGSGAGSLNLGSNTTQFSGSSMSRLIARARESQGEPIQAHNANLSTKAETSAPQNIDTGRAAGQYGDVPPTRSSVEVLNKSQLSSWMDAHALSRSSQHCAMYCRMGMEAAGINTADRPRSGDAGDYGPFLLRHGAETVSPISYVPQVGDVAVFDKTGQHPYGHIEMYDGHQWVSDFMQHSFSPYRDADSTPTFTIYRLA